MKMPLRCFFLLLSLPLYGQQVDSLKAIWQSPESSVTEQLQALRGMAVAYYDRYDRDSALAFYQLGLELARDEGLPIWELENLIDIGSTHYHDNNYEEALTQLRAALALSQKLKEKEQLPDIYRMIGVVREAQGEPDESFEYYEKSYRVSLASNDSMRMARALNSMAISYMSYHGDYPRAIEVFLQAIDLNKALGRDDQSWL